MELNAEIKALTCLGLTSSQAKVYLTLIRLGTSNAQTISNYSDIARSDVYRIMAALEKLALVEKIIASPCKFKASSPDALSVLMKRRMEETFKLQTLINETYKRFENNNIRTALEENEPQFILMSEQAGGQKRIKALETLQKSSELLISWKNFLHHVPSLVIEKFYAPLQRGVEFRFIIDTPLGRKNEKIVADVTKPLKKYPNFTIRHLPKPPKAEVLLNDHNSAWMFCGSRAGRKEGIDLYTNNPYVIALFRDYFEIQWRATIEEKTPENELVVG